MKKETSIIYKGVTYDTLKHLATDCNISYNMLTDRINRQGWTIERAIETPVVDTTLTYGVGGTLPNKFLVVTTPKRKEGLPTVQCPICGEVFEILWEKISPKNTYLYCITCGFNSRLRRHYTKLLGRTIHGYTVMSMEYVGKQDKKPHFLIKDYNNKLLAKPMTMHELLQLIENGGTPS